MALLDLSYPKEDNELLISNKNVDDWIHVNYEEDVDFKTIGFKPKGKWLRQRHKQRTYKLYYFFELEEDAVIFSALINN